jgi:hypothetical protein
MPAFITPALLADYKSDPVALCWQAVNKIRKRAAADEDRASRLAEVAAYVPHWLFSTAVNVRLADEETSSFGVANRTALHRRVDAWTQALHRKYLAVKARSIIRTDAATGTPTGAEDAIRYLSSLLERQAALNATPQQPARTLFDAFPPPTKQLISMQKDWTCKFPRVFVLRFARVLSPRERLTGQEHSAYSAAAPRSSKKPDREDATLTNKPVRPQPRQRDRQTKQPPHEPRTPRTLSSTPSETFSTRTQTTNGRCSLTQSVGKTIPTLRLATDACSELGAWRTRATRRRSQHDAPGFRDHWSAARSWEFRIPSKRLPERQGQVPRRCSFARCSRASGIDKPNSRRTNLERRERCHQLPATPFRRDLERQRRVFIDRCLAPPADAQPTKKQTLWEL